MRSADMVEGRAIELSWAMLCQNDHVFDLTLSNHCPKCMSEHVIPVSKFLGVIAPKGFALESLSLGERQMVLEA